MRHAQIYLRRHWPNLQAALLGLAIGVTLFLGVRALSPHRGLGIIRERDKQRELHQAARALAEMKELDEIAARQSWRHAHDPDEAQGFGEGRR